MVKMTQKKASIFADMEMDELDSIDSLTGQKKKTLGRPKLNPYAQEQKITTRVPKDIHRQLRIASAMTGKPMGELIVDALATHLKKYANK
jgi:predicted HicB family RNase H-like nuclease